MAQMKTVMQVVPPPSAVPPELVDETFVRIALLDSLTGQESTAWTMTISDALGLFQGMISDLREIIGDEYNATLNVPGPPDGVGLN